ncbi:MAG: hypothetical protein CL800_09905 [Citromicrobium sp.]|uniref:Uncharacterized protein n=1 Tax=Aurantiacibacter xanthus TaxID=1784712 RepID=A0A3A1P4V6_9SPHN|nr:MULTISPECIES: hypothetical protein [Erythrobacteraceae]MAQ66416.1 hypothetical protein [Sphingomonadaceae bacterium]MBV02684.1 hypothetical protein [Citromicrobium sp.]MDB2694710.1 hypothetical protein [Erythrobacter sp.]PNQ75651.1 hypothetical protein BA950_13180 [Erythrobacter sp. SAORIC-644]RIV82068.1 hypothetical protein D2V17_16080 [Aurantiacibacter xanthus]HCY56689.1 hypothetical protein [Oceanicaulis sp.]
MPFSTGFGTLFIGVALRCDFQQLVILATVFPAIGCREKIASEGQSLTQFELKVPVAQYAAIEGRIRRQYQTGTPPVPFDKKAALLISENALCALKSGLARRSVGGAQRAVTVEWVLLFCGVNGRLF